MLQERYSLANVNLELLQAAQLYLHYNSVGPRFEGIHVLCEICVQKECRRLRLLQELEDDNKLFLELTKQLDSKCSPFVKNCTKFPPSILEGCCWVGKETLKKWKRMAKKKIEGTGAKEFIQSEDYPDVVCEDSDDSLAPLNSEIICGHGKLFGTFLKYKIDSNFGVELYCYPLCSCTDNLCTDQSGRKLLPFDAWTIIIKYFNDAVFKSAEDSVPCLDCQVSK